MAESETTWVQHSRQPRARVGIPDQIHRILLYGPPGTGKSSWAGTAFAHVERVTLHAQMPPEDLIGSMALVASRMAARIQSGKTGRRFALCGAVVRLCLTR